MIPPLQPPACIRVESTDDTGAIRAVNESAFGRTREAYLVDALRSAGAVSLSMVAVAESDEVLGHVLYSPAIIESAGGHVPALALAPVAVLPGWQGQGIGTMLVQTSLERLRADGHEAVVVLGHPDFLPRFGFLPGSLWGLSLDLGTPDEAFMALELRAGSLAGVSGRVSFRPEFKNA